MTIMDEIMAVRDIKDLAKIAQELGYSDPYGQLQFSNGATASDLFLFFDDNPGAVEAVCEWLLDYGTYRSGAPLENPEHNEDDEEL